MPVYFTPPPGNPLTRLVAAILAVLVMVGAFMLGVVALAVVTGLAVILGVAMWLRTWRIRRNLRRGAATRRDGARESDIIDAEYTVISRRRDRG